MEKTAQKILVILAFIVCFSQQTSAKPGDLDSSFGENGISLPYKTNNYSFHCSTMDKNDNILIAGKIRAFQDILTIQRVKKNGSLDSSFGINGTFSFTFIEYKGIYCHDLIETEDHSIVVCGSLYNKSIIESIFLFKIKPTGTIDSTFNGSGLVIFGDSTYNYFPFTIIESINKDGFIILTSMRNKNNNVYNSGLFHINKIGLIDSSFYEFINYSPDIFAETHFYDMIIDGKKYLLAGSVRDSNSNYRPSLLRLNSDLIVDSTYGDNGFIINDILNHLIRYIQKDSDGTIFTAGNYRSGTDYWNIYLSKYSVTGNIDSSFGIDGIAKVNIQDRDFLKSLNIIPNLDNRILISGSSGFEDIDYIWIQMFNKNGIPDSSFGTDSKIMTRYSTVNTTYGFTHLQKDDKIIFIGEVGDPENRIVLYRYLTDFEVSVNDAVNDIYEFIYPNPVNNIVYINYELKSPDYIKFELYHYIGDKVKDILQSEFRETGNHNEMINLGDNLEDGLYLLKFSSSISTRIFKIQVSK